MSPKTDKRGEKPAEPAWDDEDELEAAEPAEEPDYRRRRQPVRVRRRRTGDWTRRLGAAWGWSRTRGWKPALITAAVVGVAWAGDSLLFHNPAFVLAGSDQITVSGAVHVSPARVRQLFAADLGRDIFYIPLAARQRAVEALPWVRHASVLRLWPAAIQVQIQERVPVAFARSGNSLVLLDATGVVLPAEAGPSAGTSAYNFPVLDGVPGVASAHPNTAANLAQRQPAMQLYGSFHDAIAHGDAQALGDISEIDLSHPDDLIATVAEPDTDAGAAEATTLVNLGDENFATRLNLFFSQIGGWRQKYPNMTAVDLHVDGEAIVDPGTPPAPAPAAKPSPSRRK